MQLPVGSKLYDRQPGKVVFSLTGHTAALPRLCIVTRKGPRANGKSTYTIRVVWGVSSGDDRPSENLIIDFSMGNTSFNNTGAVTAAINIIQNMMATTNFDDYVGISLNLPGESNIATA